MSNLNIDPSEGLHAAADLPDETIEYLLELMIVELAVRTDANQFEEFLRTAIARRADSEHQVRRLRHQRDLRRFAAQVMRDIRQLRLTSRHWPTPTAMASSTAPIRWSRRSS